MKTGAGGLAALANVQLADSKEELLQGLE